MKDCPPLLGVLDLLLLLVLLLLVQPLLLQQKVLSRLELLVHLREVITLVPTLKQPSLAKQRESAPQRYQEWNQGDVISSTNLPRGLFWREGSILALLLPLCSLLLLRGFGRGCGLDLRGSN